MKKCKKIVIIMLLLNASIFASAFEKGWVLGLKADFGGSLTLPSISTKELETLNPLATKMSGFVSSMLMGGQASVGYIFDAQDWIPILSDDSVLSGFAVHGYLGLGQGSTSQKITAQVSAGGESFDIYMIVNFLPTLNFGAELEVLMFDNRFSVGLGLGTKAILDFSPSYLVYSTAPDVIDTEVGEIIVRPDMMTKMNAFAFSTNLNVGYNVPILDTTELILGAYLQFNVYQPKYLTVPSSLLEMAIGAGADEEELNSPFPDYWLNSFDFGINLGLMFRL